MCEAGNLSWNMCEAGNLRIASRSEDVSWLVMRHFISVKPVMSRTVCWYSVRNVFMFQCKLWTAKGAGIQTTAIVWWGWFSVQKRTR